MVYNGKPYKNGWFGGYPFFLETPIWRNHRESYSAQCTAILYYEKKANFQNTTNLENPKTLLQEIFTATQNLCFLDFVLFGTLPETNSSPLKRGLPNRKVVFQPSIFRCELLVSGRVNHMGFVATKFEFLYKPVAEIWIEPRHNLPLPSGSAAAKIWDKVLRRRGKLQGDAGGHVVFFEGWLCRLASLWFRKPMVKKNDVSHCFTYWGSVFWFKSFHHLPFNLKQLWYQNQIPPSPWNEKNTWKWYQSNRAKCLVQAIWVC